MKLIYEPSVYLVGRQEVCEEELQRFLDDHDVSSWTTDTEVAGEKLVEVGGRLCYMSFAKPRPGGNKAYISHVLEVGHGSVTEHAVWSLIVTGVSRSLSHELVRHRHVSPSQLSQRYVDSSDVAFVVPPELKEEVELALDYLNMKKWAPSIMKWLEIEFEDLDEKQKELGLKKLHSMTMAGLEWLDCLELCQQTYTSLAEYLLKKNHPEEITDQEQKTAARKIARQTARSVLPNCAETKLFLTGNARAWRNFLELRASRHADSEIRVLANKVYEVLLKESPNLFGDYEKVSLPDGTYELQTPNRKV